jgi:hypothetical protein
MVYRGMQFKKWSSTVRDTVTCDCDTLKLERPHFLFLQPYFRCVFTGWGRRLKVPEATARCDGAAVEGAPLHAPLQAASKFRCYIAAFCPG